MRLIGIDPGSRLAGFAVLEQVGEAGATPSDYRIRDAGVLRFNAEDSWPSRLACASQAIGQLAAQWKPAEFIFEKAFYGDNVRTAIQLGEVRGAMISSAWAAGVAIQEITPAEVKKIVAGNGRATKDQVAAAVLAIFNIELGNLPFDVTDAIAIALSHAITRRQPKTSLLETLL